MPKKVTLFVPELTMTTQSLFDRDMEYYASLGVDTVSVGSGLMYAFQKQNIPIFTLSETTLITSLDKYCTVCFSLSDEEHSQLKSVEEAITSRYVSEGCVLQSSVRTSAKGGHYLKAKCVVTGEYVTCGSLNGTMELNKSKLFEFRNSGRAVLKITGSFVSRRQGVETVSLMLRIDTVYMSSPTRQSEEDKLKRKREREDQQEEAKRKRLEEFERQLSEQAK